MFSRFKHSKQRMFGEIKCHWILYHLVMTKKVKLYWKTITKNRNILDMLEACFIRKLLQILRKYGLSEYLFFIISSYEKLQELFKISRIFFFSDIITKCTSTTKLITCLIT